MASAISRTEGADRRADAKAALARYPYLNASELTDLLRWFRKEASALEVTSLVADPEIAPSYEQFKQEHLDRIKGVNLFWGAAAAIALATIAATIAWSLT
jgi:hypothetical protein